MHSQNIIYQQTKFQMYVRLSVIIPVKNLNLNKKKQEEAITIILALLCTATDPLLLLNKILCHP